MNKEIKRTTIIRDINRVSYRANPNLTSSGRYIKSLRRAQSLCTNDKEKRKYEYVINKLLHKHLIYLQETIINSYEKGPSLSTINPTFACKIQQLTNSIFAVSDNKYSLVDIDGLSKIKVLKKSVLLKHPLVLPCKVKSTDNQYRFIVQIIMTSSNVLGYASHNYEYEKSSANINHNILINKFGTGIASSILKTKQKASVAR